MTWIRDSFDNKTFNQRFALNLLTERRSTTIDILHSEEDFPSFMSNLKCIKKRLSISENVSCSQNDAYSFRSRLHIIEIVRNRFCSLFSSPEPLGLQGERIGWP